MKILCYGDSNTYGYDPCSCFGGRYPAEGRWVDLLAGMLGCETVNGGENGREIPAYPWALNRFAELLAAQKPLDLLIVMLGTNDLLQGNDPESVTARMERFLKGIDFEKSGILLVTPPPMKRGAWVPTQDLVDGSRALDESYRNLAERLGIHHAGSPELPMTFDGVHLTEEGHKGLARMLCETVQNFQ